MKRDSYVFYRSFYEAIKNLPDAERLKVYDVMTEYALEGTEQETEGICRCVFTLIKPQIDANNRKYTGGCKGGRPIKKPSNNHNETLEEPTNNHVATKVEPNANANVNVNENVNAYNKPPKKIFKKPTVEAVVNYCKERGNNIDGEHFWNFYEGSEWIRSNGVKIMNWKNVVVTWENHNKENKKSDIKILEGEGCFEY